MRYGWTSVTVGDALHGARRRAEIQTESGSIIDEILVSLYEDRKII